MNLNELSYQVRGAIYEVHNELGPGLLESVYEAALSFELASRGLHVQRQVSLPVHYKGQLLEIGFRLDVLVNDQLVVEIKSVEDLHNVHKKQLLTYLKLSGKPLGLLVNFNAARLIDREDIFRIIN